MSPKFGTSGLRGLVTELAPDCLADYVGAFLRTCPVGTGLFVAHDLRASSPDIADQVARIGQAQGLTVTVCGPAPTPALALASMQVGAAAIMVTGSHIPADRNGLKFYTPTGEITKADEDAITAALGQQTKAVSGPDPVQDNTVTERYANRYTGPYRDALAGMRIGLYAHSAVGRDMLADLLTKLGAEVIALGRANQFVPVDTEAVSQELRTQLRAWAAAHPCDAIVSTDADGDRPLLTDASGTVIPGDILGQITATALGADTVVTPVSSNTGVDQSGCFAQVRRTKIGSPHVIAAMEKAAGRIVGYEANGGFLLGFAADAPHGTLAPLMTRDALLPILAVLAASRETGVAARVAAEPPRFTAADRLQDIPADRSQPFITALATDAAARNGFLAKLDGAAQAVDQTDGLRITLQDGRIVHLRPSGNAPELRFYTEADSADHAQSTLAAGLAALKAQLGH
ncbi:phosphomannomutase [Loktanella agnita]|uniref:phosphomannomutase n=1 Tax=Loktanella agnita TaxID=287097 RepID=UPI003988C7C0